MLSTDRILNEVDLSGHVLYHEGKIFCHTVRELLEYENKAQRWVKKADIPMKYWSYEKNLYSFCNYAHHIIFKDVDTGSIWSINTNTNDTKELVDTESGPGGFSSVKCGDMLYMFPTSREGSLLKISADFDEIKKEKNWCHDIIIFLKEKGYDFYGVRSRCVSLCGEYVYFVLKTQRTDLVLEAKWKDFEPIRLIAVAGDGFYNNLSVDERSLWMCDLGNTNMNTLLQVDIRKNGDTKIIASVEKNKGAIFCFVNEKNIKTFCNVENGARYQDHYIDNGGLKAIYMEGTKIKIFDGERMYDTSISLETYSSLNNYLNLVCENEVTHGKSCV